MSKNIVIIGAGLIGASTALKLAEKGHNVTLVDRSFTDQPASGGNAGIIAYSDIFPMVSAKMLLKVPFWLANPRAMISLSPSHAIKMIPWFWEMIKSTNPQRLKDYIPAKLSLMKDALQDHYDQIDEADRARFIEETGTYYVYATKAKFESEADSRAQRLKHGYESEILSAKQSYERIPGLEKQIYRTVFEPDNANVTSPRGLLEYIREKAKNKGVKFHEANVTKIDRKVDQIHILLEDQDMLSCDDVVIAAGAFSRKLVQDVGLDCPLDTERGYNVTIPNPPFEFKGSVIAREAQIAISSFTDGLRVGGGVEFAGIDGKPRYDRIDHMLNLAQEFFPSIPDDRGDRWMGCRPCMPDDLPVLGKHPRDKRVSFAFGHGHLGMTMAAVTARHVANIVHEDKTDIDLTPFRIDRY